MADHIKTEIASRTWVVRAAGATIGESDAAVKLTEGDYPPVIYFPRDDVAMALLDKSDKSSHCPWKGDATYFTIIGKSGRLENVAWSYESPNDDMAVIKDHIAFYTDKVVVEAL